MISSSGHRERCASVDVVIPTTGRASLAGVLAALGRKSPAAMRVLVIDDRRDAWTPLFSQTPAGLAGRVQVLRSGGRGPAGARNVGWRGSRAAWVAFLDDDVILTAGWADSLLRDIADAGEDVAGVQGRIAVPLPAEHPTDWERSVAGLEHAAWVTADMAYRRADLAAVGGFDERFPRAYREDADLALRVQAGGRRLVRGARLVLHPVPPAAPWVSVRKQAGNADDALMTALHGPDWPERIGAPRGRRPRHFATAGALCLAVASIATARAAAGHMPRMRRAARVAAAGSATTWAVLTGELAWRRIAPGPRSGREVATMSATSAVLPLAATGHYLRGVRRRSALLSGSARAPHPDGARPPAAVLLDRDGTLIEDVPYNGDPDSVRPLPGVRESLDRLRAAGVPLGVVSNQSGVARGLISREQVDAVNRRVEHLLGPLGPSVVCPHGAGDGCGCRKPAPGLLLRAADLLGVDAASCAVVGDIGSDVEAARAAGARGVLVPTRRTLREELAAADEIAPDLGAAVDLLLGYAR